MPASPTSRTLKLLRDEGWRAAVVEKWIPGVNIRKDLFEFIDILALKGGETLAVQACAASSMSARQHKIVDDCAEQLSDVREAGWRVEVIGWRKNSKGRWVARRVDLS